MKESISEYIKKKYGVEPEYLWNDDENAALRNKQNKKWFGVFICNLPKSKLGLKGEDRVDIINLKCDPLMLASVVDNKHIFRAYHMNKQHWISVLLDGSVDFDELCFLVQISFALVDGQNR